MTPQPLPYLRLVKPIRPVEVPCGICRKVFRHLKEQVVLERWGKHRITRHQPGPQEAA